ncbi:MAG: RluA family pseudouridine synthase [Alphaproteobacteria bacterium]
MSGVSIVEVGADEGDLRIDRWFKRHYPDLSHIRLQKLLRKGHVRLDGKRIKASTRIAAGQSIRVPPLGNESKRPPKQTPNISDADADMIRAAVLHMDDDLIAINKPPGLAVQGGTGITRSVDGMLDALQFDAPERPRLVHRLDKDTSGVLVLARGVTQAAKLTAAFRAKSARKIYWAVVVGVPELKAGKIDMALSKLPGAKGERMVPDPKDGKRAVTYYRIAEKASRKAAWLVMEPETGRTHQLRVHATALGTPIMGDGKYGGAEAFLKGPGLSRKLHLHARAIRLPHPAGGEFQIIAPMPEHMSATWEFLGFEENQEADPFADSF